MLRSKHSLVRIAAWMCLFPCASMSHADAFGEGDRVMLSFGPYVAHPNETNSHNKWPHLFGAEWESRSHWLAGAVAFKNSYHQQAAYAYAGRRWFLNQLDPNLYLKISAGVVYGYKEPFEDRLPINENGIGLGLVPAIGYQFGRANAQIVFLGTVAVAITFGYDFWN